jgi:hypothetical protein
MPGECAAITYLPYVVLYVTHITGFITHVAHTITFSRSVPPKSMQLAWQAIWLRYGSSSIAPPSQRERESMQLCSRRSTRDHCHRDGAHRIVIMCRRVDCNTQNIHTSGNGEPCPWLPCHGSSESRKRETVHMSRTLMYQGQYIYLSHHSTRMSATRKPHPIPLTTTLIHHTSYPAATLSRPNTYARPPPKLTLTATHQAQPQRQ